MDQEKLGSVLFLASLMGMGCAEGTEGAGHRPSPYLGDGGDTRGASPWTEPFDTTGPQDDSGGDSGDGSNGDDGDSGWPSEGETGQVSGGSTGDIPPGGADDDGATTGADGGDEGDYGSSGYAEPSPPTENPCPDLVQLYTDCIPGLDYATELGYCEDARQSAVSISTACSLAHSDYLSCLSTLDCATLLSEGIPFPCLLQGAAVELSC